MGWLSLSNEKPAGSMFRERRRKREISLDVPQKAPVCRVFTLSQKEVPVPIDAFAHGGIKTAS
jgi:hypothetical protein